MILDASDMSAARQVADFVAWVKRKAEELSARPEAKSFARSGAQLPKKFYDELYPLALFVEHEFTAAPNAVVTPNLGNDNFDATVFFGDSIDTLYIEITRAKDGYDESLRDEVLTREGSVCVTGPIQKVEGRRERLIASSKSRMKPYLTRFSCASTSHSSWPQSGPRQTGFTESTICSYSLSTTTCPSVWSLTIVHFTP